MTKFLSIREAYDKMKKDTYYKIMDKNTYPIRYGYSASTPIEYILVNSILEFTKDEKEILTTYINKVNTKLCDFPMIDIEFVKVSSNFEFGYPHTLQKMIILPINFIQQLTTQINPTALTTILHEKIHIIQRIYPSYFTKLYEKKYNFTQINTEKVLNNVHLDNYIINPDGYDLSWVYPIEYGKYFILPYCSYNYVLKRLVTRLIVFDMNRNILYNGDASATSTITGVREFINKFANVGSYYHVNEIAAYDLSEYCINGRYLV
jgi:hypothetical protein